MRAGPLSEAEVAEVREKFGVTQEMIDEMQAKVDNGEADDLGRRLEHMAKATDNPLEKMRATFAQVWDLPLEQVPEVGE